MRVSKLNLCCAIAALITLQVCTPTRSLADTYQLFNLGSDQGYFFYAMDDSGHVVINNPTSANSAPCTLGGACYFTFLNGLSTGHTNVAPTLAADNGTPCVPAVPAGGSVEHGVCNNGRDAFTGFISSSQVFGNVYTGSIAPVLLAAGGDGAIFMNALGDIVFDDTHYTEDWFMALDLTTRATPEPGSLLLLATGTLAAAGMLRRRLPA